MPAKKKYPASKAKHKATTSPYVVIRKSGIHHKGGFAKIFIPEGTRVIEYTGDRITTAEGTRRAEARLEAAEGSKTMGAVYIFTVNKKKDVDGAVWWNTAKNLNHSCEPNCETDVIRGRIWIIATRDIEKGEELLYNYGWDLEDYESHPCKCGSENCVGYIVAEENFKNLKRRLARKKAIRAKKR